MTISAYIANILNEYSGMVIDTSHVGAGSDQYGLYKSPNRNTREFNDSSYEITEGYQFYARQNAASLVERKEANELLEDLAYWIDDYPYTHGFPSLGGNREVTGMSITGTPYVMAAEDKETLYQMSLSITYIREREEF